MTAVNAPFVIAGWLQDAHRRRRVAEVLQAVAFDLADPYAHEQLSADDWVRLRELVSDSVEAATKAALDVLVTRLDKAMVRADPVLIERLEHVRRRAALGID